MKKILIVEGQEDENFFKELLRQLNLQSIEVKSNPSGKGNAIDTFASVIQLENNASRAQIGLVVDADFLANGGGYASTLQLLNQRINSALTQHAGGGLKAVISTKPSLRVGAWIMPNNALDGYIEHFLESSLAAAEANRFQFASQSFNAALNSGLQFPMQSIHHGKARVGTYLAWQNPPRSSFAQCLHKGLLNSNSNYYVALSNWLNWLYT